MRGISAPLARLTVLAGLLGVLAFEDARADLVLDLETGGVALPCGNCGPSGETFGWAFNVANAISIDGLGLWDAGADGLGVASTGVGIWTSAGTLLASATVSDASTVVASASADGHWLFESVAPFTLNPGDYVIGSVFFDATPLAQTGAPFTTIADVTLAGGVSAPAPDTGLSFPSDPFVPIFGPTLRLASAVPEPATLVLAALGLAGLGLSRRRT